MKDDIRKVLDQMVLPLALDKDYLAARIAEGTEPRDEYHTMSELYDYRMAYNALAAWSFWQMGFKVVKSKKHHDGELCFGGEYFIVVMELPTGQVSNHYKLEHWNAFPIPEEELPPKWDGHTPEVAFNRMYNFMTNRTRMHERFDF